MPYTIEDVDKHKKGLSAKQKAQWVAVANSVLAKCKKDGGSDATCAPAAIRQANGVTNNQLHVNIANTGYVIRQVNHQGRNHIVVPVVMMVEGVHAGSRGPLLHKAEELGKFPASWDGIPVVINHPMDSEGHNISANSPEIIDSSVTVGRVYHAQMVDSKLMAEAYLDEARLTEVSPQALSAIMNGEPLEVSIGVFTDEDTTPGLWNNEQYNAVAVNHRPDHLALLPGGTGACSWNDGCGIRVNQSQEGGKKSMKITGDALDKLIKDLNKGGYSASAISANEDASLMERVNEIREVVDSMDSNTSVHYLEDVYDEYVIYCTRLRNPQTGSYGEDTMYKQTYQIDPATGNITLTGDPIQVEKQVTFVNVNKKITRTKYNNNSKGGNEMNGKEGCGQCMEKIVAIINSNAAGMTTKDREWLLTQEEATLDMLLAKKPVEKVVEVNAQLTSEQIINAMSAEDKAALAYGKKQLAERRATMIKGIQDNTAKDLWSTETLNAMDEGLLAKVYESVKKEEAVDYTFSANSRMVVANAGEIEALYPSGVEINKK